MIYLIESFTFLRGISNIKENYEPGQCHLQLVPDMGHNITDKQRTAIAGCIRQFLLEKKEILTVRVILTHRTKE